MDGQDQKLFSNHNTSKINFKALIFLHLIELLSSIDLIANKGVTKEMLSYAQLRWHIIKEALSYFGLGGGGGGVKDSIFLKKRYGRY